MSQEDRLTTAWDLTWHKVTLSWQLNKNSPWILHFFHLIDVLRNLYIHTTHMTQNVSAYMSSRLYFMSSEICIIVSMMHSASIFLLKFKILLPAFFFSFIEKECGALMDLIMGICLVAAITVSLMCTLKVVCWHFQLGTTKGLALHACCSHVPSLSRIMS